MNALSWGEYVYLERLLLFGNDEFSQWYWSQIRWCTIVYFGVESWTEL